MALRAARTTLCRSLKALTILPTFVPPKSPPIRVFASDVGPVARVVEPVQHVDQVVPRCGHGPLVRQPVHRAELHGVVASLNLRTAASSPTLSLWTTWSSSPTVSSR